MVNWNQIQQIQRRIPFSDRVDRVRHIQELLGAGKRDDSLMRLADLGEDAFATGLCHQLAQRQNQAWVRKNLELLKDRCPNPADVRALDEALASLGSSPGPGGSPPRRVDVTPDPFFAELLEHPFKNYQLMLLLKNRLRRRGRPFEGLRCAVILHFLPDLVPFMTACEELGMNPADTTLFYKPRYRYPYLDRMIAWFEGRQYRVFPVGTPAHPRSGVMSYVESLYRWEASAANPTLIIEDGGYIAPGILGHRGDREKGFAPRVLGSVEQTTRGIMNIEEAVLGKGKPREPGDSLATLIDFPVMSLPNAGIKRRIEPPIIGRAVVRGLESLTGRLVPGSHVAVLGAGAIGMEVIRALKHGGCRIKVFDQDMGRRMELHHEAGVTLTDSAVEAVRNCQFIIGCSGRQSVTPSVIEAAMNGAYIVSASSETYEIDLDHLADRSLGTPEPLSITGPAIGAEQFAGSTYRIADRGVEKRIHLIANGIPVTFWGFPGMPPQFADLVMSLILMSAAELAVRNGPAAPPGHRYPSGILETSFDQLVKDYRVEEAYLEMYHRAV